METTVTQKDCSMRFNNAKNVNFIKIILEVKNI